MINFYFPKHFTLEELVPKALYLAHRDKCWMLFDWRVLWTADMIREHYDLPVYCNNWDNGGKLEQAGYRTVIDPNTPLSPHYRGAALDLKIKGVTASQFRKDVRSGRLSAILQYITRIEDSVTWVHIDTANVGGGGITFFKK